MRANSQILQASVLGTQAFARGIKAPCEDPKMMKMVERLHRQIGQTPKSQAPTIALLRAWNHAWHAANAVS